MKFPRNARIFRGQLDAAPFATIFFLLVIFMMLGLLVYTPGVHVQLPVANDLPGTDKPPVSVALDKTGQLYFQNQWIGETELKLKLRKLVSQSPKPLVLILQADEAVAYNNIIRVAVLAREAGISEALLATLPGSVSVAP